MDKMHIKEDLVYNKHTGKLVGFVNLGRVSFRIFIKGGGGKHDKYRVKGGKDYSNISSVFPSVKNDIVLINLIILGGSGGMLPQETFLMFQPLRQFLVASEHSDGEKPVSNIHWFPSILSQILQGCGMCLLPRVARRFS